MLEKKKINLETLFLSGAIMVTTLASMYCLMFRSGLKWTFEQKEYWDALSELIVLFYILVFTMYLLRDKKNLLWTTLVLEGLLFSFLHSYLYAIIFGGIYMFGVYLSGRTIGALFHLSEVMDDIFACIITGIACEIFLVGLASVLRIGTPEKVRIIFCIILCVELLWNRKQMIGLLRDSSKKVACISQNLCMNNILLLAGILTLFFLQVGRASISNDYDSVWYGLRSDYMLAPFTGIYDQVISLGCVYTYCKGIEILSLPFSGLSSLEMVYSVNLFLVLGVLLCIYHICRIKNSRTSSLIITLASVATPAIMNMSVTAKSDIATLFLQLVAIYFMEKGVLGKKEVWYVWSISAAVLSFAFKSTSFVFSSVLIFVCIVFFLKNKRRMFYLSNLRILIPEIIALIVVFGRNIYLTGCPANFIFPKIWKILGLSFKYPFEMRIVGVEALDKLLDWDFVKERLSRLRHIFFIPITNITDHIIIAWGGILFALIFALLIIHIFSSIPYHLKKLDNSELYRLFFCLFITISMASIASMILLEKPDGNYFMLFYVITYIFALHEFDSKNNEVSIIWFPPLLAGAMLCLATSWGYTLGLSPICIDNLGYCDSRPRIQQYMKNKGLDETYNWLDENGKKRIMFFSSDINYNLLPAIIDSWHDTTTWGGGVTLNANTFREYLEYAGIEYILLDQEYIRNDLHAQAIITEMASRGYLEVGLLEDRHALVKVKKNGGDIDQILLKYLDREYIEIQSGVYGDSWVGQSICIRMNNEKPASILVTGFYPNDITGKEFVEIFVDGNLYDIYQLNENKIQIRFSIEEPGIHDIVLKNLFSIQPTAPDARTDLAYLFDSVIIEAI